VVEPGAAGPRVSRAAREVELEPLLVRAQVWARQTLLRPAVLQLAAVRQAAPRQDAPGRVALRRAAALTLPLVSAAPAARLPRSGAALSAGARRDW